MPGYCNDREHSSTENFMGQWRWRKAPASRGWQPQITFPHDPASDVSPGDVRYNGGRFVASYRNRRVADMGFFIPREPASGTHALKTPSHSILTVKRDLLPGYRPYGLFGGAETRQTFGYLNPSVTRSYVTPFAS